LPKAKLPREPAHSDRLACSASARHRRRRTQLDAFPRILRGQHPQPAHAVAYYRAAEEFLVWCADAGVLSIATVQPVHVATWIEMSVRKLAAPLVQQRLAALRHLFDWLVNGQVVPINPAHTVRGPRHVVTCDKSRYLILRRCGRCSTASIRRPLPVYLRPLSRSMREPGPRNARLDVFRDKPPVPHNDWGCQPLRFYLRRIWRECLCYSTGFGSA
jgi:hypothetical protein